MLYDQIKLDPNRLHWSCAAGGATAMQAKSIKLDLPFVLQAPQSSTPWYCHYLFHISILETHPNCESYWFSIFLMCALVFYSATQSLLTDWLVLFLFWCIYGISFIFQVELVSNTDLTKAGNELKCHVSWVRQPLEICNSGCWFIYVQHWLC